MESNLLLEQYSWYKKQQLAKAPFECLLNADIEPNPHQVNAFCAAIQALKTGGIILADEVGYDVCAAKQNTFVLCESCIGNFRIPSL